jgi:hypothetical protein
MSAASARTVVMPASRSARMMTKPLAGHRVVVITVGNSASADYDLALKRLDDASTGRVGRLDTER